MRHSAPVADGAPSTGRRMAPARPIHDPCWNLVHTNPTCMRLDRSQRIQLQPNVGVERIKQRQLQPNVAVDQASRTNSTPTLAVGPGQPHQANSNVAVRPSEPCESQLKRCSLDLAAAPGPTPTLRLDRPSDTNSNPNVSWSGSSNAPLQLHVAVDRRVHELQCQRCSWPGQPHFLHRW